MALKLEHPKCICLPQKLIRVFIIKWDLFKDDQLNQLIGTALINNKDLLIAGARVEEAQAILGFTKADMWPRLNYTAQYQIQNVNQLVGPTDGTNDFLVGGGSLNWEIDFWGKFRRANEAARAELVASEFGRRSIQVGIIATVADLYFTMIGLNEQLEVSIRTYESRLESVRIIEERFNKGYTAEIDLNQAQIQAAIAQASIPKYERGKAQVANAIGVLLGGNPQNLDVAMILGVIADH